MSIFLHVFGEDLGALLLGGDLGVGMIGHRICICSAFIDTAKSFSKVTNLYSHYQLTEIFKIILEKQQFY